MHRLLIVCFLCVLPTYSDAQIFDQAFGFGTFPDAEPEPLPPLEIPEDWFRIEDFDPSQPGGEVFGYISFAYGLLTGGYGPYV